MNKIYLYLTALIVSICITSCDRGDDPSYSDLTIDTTDIEFDLDNGQTSKTVKILSDNGDFFFDYQNKNDITSYVIDTSRVEAKINDRTITFTAKKRGVVNFTLNDWTNKGEKRITVNVHQTVDLLLEKDLLEARLDEGIMKTNIYDGNGGYTIESLNPEIATAVIDEDSEVIHNDKDPYVIQAGITVTPITAGEAKFKVTDSLGKETTLTTKIAEAKLEFALVDIDPTQTVVVPSNNTPLVIKYRGGNPEFKIEKNRRLTVTIDNTAKTITLTSKTAGDKSDLKITDSYGQVIQLKILTDYPFLDSNIARVFMSGEYMTLGGMYDDVESGYVGSLDASYVKASGWGYGLSLTFDGNLTVGTKKNAKILTLIDDVPYEDATISLLECKLVKKTADTAWFTYIEAATSEFPPRAGFMVLKLK